MGSLLAWLAAALRRRWWIAALVAVLAACLAFYRYAGPGASARQVYVATQRFTIVLLPPDAATAGDGARAVQDEQTIARMLADGGLLSSQPLDDAIAARLAATGGQGAGITARDAMTALGATHTGNMVTLRTRWRSLNGTRALAAAASAALAGGALLPALAAAHVMPSGASLRVEVDSPPNLPVLDSAAAGAARAQLAEQIVLGVMGGLLLALAVELFDSRSRVASRAH